ncbi:MAG: CapA family protein [Myxococcaceae bacterium]
MRWLALLGVLSACAHAPGVASRDDVLWFGGDVHFGERGVRVLDESLVLDGSLVVNLEGPIAASVGTSSAQRLINPPSADEFLRSAGVVAAGVENNHSGDEGDLGRARTREVLSRTGIAALGTAKVGPAHLVQVDLTGGVPADLAARLASLPHPSVVLFHVVAPPLYLPELVLEQAVAIAVAARVDAVLSHGSHAVAKVERVGATVIAWGLGNVVFDCECTRETGGVLVRLQFSGGRVADVEVVPIDAGLDGVPARAAHDVALELQLLEGLGSRFAARTPRGARL